MNYKYFTSPPLIFMSKRQTINVTFVSLMSTIYNNLIIYPVSCDVTTAELFSKGVQAEVITMRGGHGCHRLALPENLLVSNKTIPVTKLQYNKWVRRETGDCSHVPDPNSWLRNELSSLVQWQVQAPVLTRDTWHDVTENVKWHKPTLVCLSPVPSQLDY